MTHMENWPKIAVVGAGAVGGYFGGMLARAGAPVVMIGRASFVEAVRQNGLFLDTLHFQENVRVEAATDLAAAHGAEFVLFCVKTTANAETARALAPALGPGTIVACLQNGVDNAEQIRGASGLEVISCVVYVAASAPRPGVVLIPAAAISSSGPAILKLKNLPPSSNALPSPAASRTTLPASFGPSSPGTVP